MKSREKIAKSREKSVIFAQKVGIKFLKSRKKL